MLIDDVCNLSNILDENFHVYQISKSESIELKIIEKNVVKKNLNSHILTSDKLQSAKISNYNLSTRVVFIEFSS